MMLTTISTIPSKNSEKDSLAKINHFSPQKKSTDYYIDV